MTDFLKSISKNTYVPCLEKPPDPNVIEESGDMLNEVLETERLTILSYIYVYIFIS